MPQKNKRQAAAKPNTTQKDDSSPKARGGASTRTPFEESLQLWSRYARETGETVTDYLKRFGGEQQKNYESWATSVKDATRPAAREKEATELQARLEEWNARAKEIGDRVREAFQKALEPQKDLLDLWMKPYLPKDATNEDRSREATDLIQKMWSGLTGDVSRFMFSAMRRDQGVEDLARVQEESLKQFYDSFQKLTQIYFTSPGFVTMFGKTLDSSLDSQKFMKGQENLFNWMTTFPSRQQITELNEAVRDLTEKMTRMATGRA